MSSRFSSSSRVYECKPNNINKKLIKVKWICKKKKETKFNNNKENEKKSVIVKE